MPPPIEIEMTPCVSKAIFAHGYDAASKTARIQMANGRVYDFEDVEPGKYQALTQAESIGGHFNENWLRRAPKEKK
jgi:hypothetical protein